MVLYYDVEAYQTIYVLSSTFDYVYIHIHAQQSDDRSYSSLYILMHQYTK